MFYNMIIKNGENDHGLLPPFVAPQVVLCIKLMSIN